MNLMDEDLYSYSPYWETEEFEDLVTRGIIGLYETKIKPEKKGPKSCRFDQDLFLRVRNFGLYFPSNDRMCMVNASEGNNEKTSLIQNIDPFNDGFPDKAILSSSHDKGSDYLWSFFIERVRDLPKPFQCKRNGKIYRVSQIFFGSEKVDGCGTYVIIDKNGDIESAHVVDQHYDRITGRNITISRKPRMLEDTGAALDFYSLWTSVAIQFYQDRRHLWNVQAKEGIAKATFAVHPEQIKSLFYSRNLPLTETGRKRPILHWVKCHQRRMKEGTDVDIEKYLRGTNSFVFNGTKFEIINPLKAKRN